MAGFRAKPSAKQVKMAKQKQQAVNTRRTGNAVGRAFGTKPSAAAKAPRKGWFG